MRVLLIAIAVVFLGPAVADSNEIVNNGRIDSAIVYHDRASVKRIAKVDFPAGNHTLVIDSLPAAIDDNTLRISAQGSAGITIFNVAIAPKEFAKAVDPVVKKLHEAIEQTQSRLRMVQMRIDARRTQVRFLEKLAKARAESAGKELTSATPVDKPTAEELGKLLDFLYDRKVAAEQSASDMTRKKDGIIREINKLTRELNNVRGTLGKRTKKVVIDFSADKAGSTRFSVEYMVYGVGWAPHYVIRGDADEERLSISYGASVWQRSGENWENVKLYLSTASPRIGAKPPKLKPWIVRPLPILRPQAAFKSVQMKEDRGLKQKASMPASGAPMEAEEAKIAMASVKPSGTAVSFEVARRGSVVSGGQITKVTIAQLSFKTKNIYFSAPKLSANVFLMAKFSNESEYPFLPGETSVFLDNNFVGKGRMKATAPGQEAELGLGVDSGFKIKRKLIKKETSREGMISKKTVVSHIYEIELESYKKKETVVEIKDHLPLSRDEAIVVRGVKLLPKPDEKDEQNILTWNIAIKSKQKKKIRIEFYVEYPRGQTPVGL